MDLCCFGVSSWSYEQNRQVDIDLLLVELYGSECGHIGAGIDKCTQFQVGTVGNLDSTQNV